MTAPTEIKIPGTQQKLFISPVLDLYDNYPVTLEVSERNDAILANTALEKAHNKYPDSTPVYHSDRGFAYTRTVFKNLLQSYGMTQSMSRVSRCIDNGPCESFQGRFKDILFILYPDIKTKDQMLVAIEGTLNYYINSYPQKRFNGKTCGQVREEALSSNEPINYPIKKANKYTFKVINYMKDIVSEEDISYKITIQNPTDSVITLMKNDEKENLMKSQKETILENETLSAKEEDEAFYYVRFKKTGKLKNTDLITIHIDS